MTPVVSGTCSEGPGQVQHAAAQSAAVGRWGEVMSHMHSMHRCVQSSRGAQQAPHQEARISGAAVRAARESHAVESGQEVKPKLSNTTGGGPGRAGWPGSTARRMSRPCAAEPGVELKSPATSIGMSALAAIFSSPFSSVCTYARAQRTQAVTDTLGSRHAQTTTVMELKGFSGN